MMRATSRHHPQALRLLRPDPRLIRGLSKAANGLPHKFSVKPALSSNRLYLEKRRDGNPKLYNIISRAALSLPKKDLASQPSLNAELKRKIPDKTMEESYVEEFLRFSSDPSVKEDYVNMYGAIRIGKVLEDLDAIAGSIAYLHCDDGGASDEPLGVTIVTASVDRMDLGSSIPSDQDIKLSGHVTHVGNSSMEVTITVESCESKAPPLGQERIGSFPEDYNARLLLNEEPILKAKFIMVALDRETGKPTTVPQLRLESERDRELFLEGAEHRARKQVARQISLDKAPPSVEEMILIHSLYREYIQYLDPSFNVEKPENVVWMKDTVKQSLVLCMPQDRNIHNKVFGGYLMRLAFELAYSTGYIFTRSRISFVAVDDIIFRQPVSIGSLLSLTSQIVYSKGSPSRSFQVSVKADVIDPIHDTQATTNTFQFTFAVPPNTPLPKIMPRSYDETMRYIGGQRRRDKWMKNTMLKRLSQP